MEMSRLQRDDAAFLLTRLSGDRAVVARRQLPERDCMQPARVRSSIAISSEAKS